MNLSNCLHIAFKRAAREWIVASVGKRLSFLGDRNAVRVTHHFTIRRRGVERVGVLYEHQLGHALHLDTEATEDAKPNHYKGARHKKSTNDHVADGAATGYAGNEKAHERSPSDPPSPVEDSPPVHEFNRALLIECHRRVDHLDPLLAQAMKEAGITVGAHGEVGLGSIELVAELLKCIRFKCNLNYVPHIVPSSLDEFVEAIPGVVEKHNRQQKDISNREGECGQVFDASVDAGEHGKRRHDGDDHNHYYLVTHRGRVAAEAQALSTGQN